MELNVCQEKFYAILTNYSKTFRNILNAGKFSKSTYRQCADAKRGGGAASIPVLSSDDADITTSLCINHRIKFLTKIGREICTKWRECEIRDNTGTGEVSLESIYWISITWESFLFRMLVGDYVLPVLASPLGLYCYFDFYVNTGHWMLRRCKNIVIRRYISRRTSYHTSQNNDSFHERHTHEDEQEFAGTDSGVDQLLWILALLCM